MKTNNKGFSLVELIVVIAIMAILAAVAIPTFSGFITKAQVSNDVSFINDLTYAAKIANSADHNGEAVVAYVEVSEDGKITSMGYTVAGATIEITKNASTGVISATSTASDANVNAADVAIGKEVGATVDWSYTFQSAKKNGAGTYTIGTDGKSLNVASGS